MKTPFQAVVVAIISILLGLAAWPAKAALYHYSGELRTQSSSGGECPETLPLELYLRDDARPQPFEGYALLDEKVFVRIVGSELDALTVIVPSLTGPLSDNRLQLRGLGSAQLGGELHAQDPPAGSTGCYIRIATLSLSLKDALTAEQYADVAARSEIQTQLLKLAALAQAKRFVEATDLAQQILVSAERIVGADDPRLETFLQILVSTLLEVGQGAKTEPLLRREIALEEHGATAGNPRLAENLEALGWLLLAETRYSETESLARRALALREATVGTQSIELVAPLDLLGVTEMATGHYAEAEALMKRALAISESTTPPVTVAISGTLIAFGAVLELTGRYGEAEALVRRALAMDELTFGADSELVSRDVSVLGGLLVSVHRFADAEPYFRRELAIVERLHGPDHLSVAYAQNYLGWLLTQMHRYPEAEPLLRQAIANFEHNFGPDYSEVARPRMNLGDLLRRTSHYREAENQLLRAYRVARGANMAYHTWRGAGYLMDLYREPKYAHPALAIYYGKQAVNTLQTLRGNLSAGKDTETSFVDATASTYHTLADLLIRAGRLNEAQEVLAMLKEQEFHDFTERGSDTDSRKTVASLTPGEQRLSDLSLHWIEVGQQVAVLEERYRNEGDSFKSGADYERLKALRQEKEAAEMSFNEQLAAIAVASSGDARDQQERREHLSAFSTAIRGTLKRLGHGTVLVQYVVLDDRIDILLTTPLIPIAKEVPIQRAALNELIYGYREVLQTPGADPLPKAQALYKLLIRPIEPELRKANAHTVMLSLDDTLRYLPFAALHDGNGYLIENYALALTTAQTLDKLAVPAAATTAPDGEAALGLGVTLGHEIEDTHERFKPLPMVGAELAAIAGPNGVLVGRVLLDPQFDADSLRDGLSRGVPIIHIASHFKFDPASANRSFLLLGDGTSLSLNQIGNLDFSAVDLLTLSACDTALGGDESASHGAEVESLGGTAQQKGARAVLATLWAVNDSSTALLMRSFYANRKGQQLDKADALREAQLALLHGSAQLASLPADVRGALNVGGAAPLAVSTAPDPKAPFAHPYYWAPFILMGNWQ